MKKILVITPACHFSNRGAAQNDIYATIRLLKDFGYAVALYTIDSSAQPKSVLAALQSELEIDVRTFLPSESRPGWIRRAFHTWALFDRAAAVFAELSEDKAFRDYLTTWQPDGMVSFCSYSWPVLALAHEQGIKTILRSHNFEASFFWEALKPRGYLNPANYLRYGAKYLGERRAVKFADVTATLPFAEIALYRLWKKEAVVIFTLTFLGNVITPPRLHYAKKPLDLFYLGASYNVIFHLRGVKTLIEEIVPRVRAQAPGTFRWHVCGGKLPAYLVAQCNGSDLIYEGYVPNLDSFLSTMDAGVFPVMTGKTMKGKVFESFCRAFPIVIPRLGLGGYELEHDKNVLIADTIPDFAEQVIRLKDDELRSKLATGAHEFARREFSQDTITAVFRKILNRLEL